MTLKPFAEGLVSLVNHVLALDPESPARLRPLAGRSLAVEIEGSDQPLHVVFGEAGIALAEEQGVADASLRASVTALLSLALSRGQGNTGAVEFRGDISVVHGVKQLLAGLEIDWEEQLSRLTGDLLAHRIGNLGRGLSSWLRGGAETLERNVGEYLSEESGALPAAAQVRGFLSDVDRLRQDVDRLQARLQLLERGSRS